MPAYRPHSTHLCVQLKPPHSQIHVGEALVSCDGVDLGELILSEAGSHIMFCLAVVEVEGLLACAKDSWHAVAVTERELDLYVDSVSAAALDPFGTEPVILVRAHDIAHLVRMNGAEVFVHFVNCIPLPKKEEEVRFGCTTNGMHFIDTTKSFEGLPWIHGTQTVHRGLNMSNVLCSLYFTAIQQQLTISNEKNSKIIKS